MKRIRRIVPIFAAQIVIGNDNYVCLKKGETSVYALFLFSTSKTFFIFLVMNRNNLFILSMSLCLLGGNVSAQKVQNDKPRVVVLTDAETDDRCSMVHFLLYANDMQVDAIVQSNSCFQRHGWSSQPWLSEMIDAYGKVYPNLKVHDANYPTPAYLKSVCYVGDENPEHVCLEGHDCPGLYPGMPSRIDPTDWADTPGSDRIVEILLEEDPRPVYIGCWGGGNTAARAFAKLKTQYPDQYERAVSKAVMYCIWYQDAAGNYIEQNHPRVTLLLNHHFSGSWDYGTMHNTDSFVEKYMRNGKNPLGELYTQSYISEGDTPAFLYSIDNGLRSYLDPTYGGWGGRFYKVEGFDNVYRDTGSGQLREWIEPALHDFQARLEWCITPQYGDANHAPIVQARDGKCDLTVHAGEMVTLYADVSDPDPIDVEGVWKTRASVLEQAGVTYQMLTEHPEQYIQTTNENWYQYPAGSYQGFVDLLQTRKGEVSFRAPKVDKPETLHIILEAADNTTPRLYGYCRYIITVLP